MNFLQMRRRRGDFDRIHDAPVEDTDFMEMAPAESLNRDALVAGDQPVPVTVINKYAVAEEAIDEFVAELRSHREFLVTQDGFQNGCLYRKCDGTGRFNFVNVAVWQSRESIAAARERLASHFLERGTEPDAVYRRLGIEFDIAMYETLDSYQRPVSQDGQQPTARIAQSTAIRRCGDRNSVGRTLTKTESNTSVCIDRRS